MNASASGNSDSGIGPSESRLVGCPFGVSLVTATVRCHRERNKKADVAEHPEVFDHVGLLVNEPPGQAGLPFT